MYYIYIIYSFRFDKYYIGQTIDIERRLFEHNNSSRLTYTSKYRPWVLKANFFAGETRSDAVKMEKYIKRQKSRSFMEQLILFQDDKEKIDQLVRVPMHRN